MFGFLLLVVTTLLCVCAENQTQTTPTETNTTTVSDSATLPDASNGTTITDKILFSEVVTSQSTEKTSTLELGGSHLQHITSTLKPESNRTFQSSTSDPLSRSLISSTVADINSQEQLSVNISEISSNTVQNNVSETTVSVPEVGVKTSTLSVPKSEEKESTTSLPEVGVKTSTSSGLKSEEEALTSSVPVVGAKPSNRTLEDFVDWLESIHPESSTDKNDAINEQPQDDEYDRSQGTTQQSLESTSRTEIISPSSSDVTTDHFEDTEEFIRFLDSIHPDNSEQTDLSRGDEINHTHISFNKVSFDPDLIPPQQFIDWLNSIHPDKNATDTTSIIDTSIITTEKLIIVVSTICGTFVVFVTILIIVSCCRRKQNARSDSEKSDFSVTSGVSAVSHGSTISTITGKQEVHFSKKNDLFMGIPPNNKIWKELEQLPPTASSVMPECTKM